MLRVGSRTRFNLKKNNCITTYMNTNRIVDTDPLEDIDNDDDLLFTNNFVSSVSRHDTTQNQKGDFRRYYEDKQKKMKNKKIIELVDEEDVYDGFTNVNFHNKSEVVNKKSSNVIKTEITSVISIDSINRNINRYREANSFKIDLGKSFYNVKSVKLISSSIPNTDQVIKETPLPIRNNLISWQNLEDQYIGVYVDCTCSTVITHTVDLVVPGHGLETQEYIEPLTIQVSNSTTTPSIDGKWSVTVVDSQTLRIPFYGGVTVSGLAKVDTGFPTYTVAITPGNYSIITLSEEAERKMNLVRRTKGTGVFHYFTVESNLDTDITTFRSYITKELVLDSISTEISSFDINVESEQHGFKDGDYVLMIGITSMGGLSSNILNGLFVIKEATRSSFKYEVNQKATFSADGGGNAIKTGKPTEFRFLFDTADTKIVYNIGFPDEDSGIFMNTTTETPLDIYTKSVTGVSQIGDYIEFLSPSHGLEECNIVQINSISNGESPTIFLDAPHGLSGIQNIFIYYPHSTPNVIGFLNVRVNGASTLVLESFTVTSPGSGLGEVKIGGDSIKLANFRSIPTITNRRFQIEDVTTDTFKIHVHEGLVSVVDQVTDTVVRTNNLHVNHPNHGFNELVGIYDLPFLQAAWDEYLVPDSRATDIIEGGSGLLVACGIFGPHPNRKYISTSTDGINWTNRDSGLATGICYAPYVDIIASQLYVTVRFNLIQSSPDAIIWTTRNTISYDLTSVVWSPELQIFVAIGFNKIVTSYDGITWSLVTTLPPFSTQVIAWSPDLGLFVVLGLVTGSHHISYDGIVWTEITSPNAGWTSVVWSPELSIFVAVANINPSDSTKCAMTSPDGINWTLRTTPTQQWVSLSWSPELRIFLAAGGAGSPHPFMISRDGINWSLKSYTPSRAVNTLLWSPSLSKFIAGTRSNSYLHSNITYGDIYCETLVPHGYTGVRYNDADFPASTVVTDNVDIDIPSHGLVTNDEIIVVDSTTVPSIDGTFFVEVVDSDTIRIPFTITSAGTCKVRHGDSIIFTGTNSVPGIDVIKATVIGTDVNDPNYLEISIGVTITVSGNTGIIGRRNIASLHRVEPSEPGGDSFVGIPLEIINDTNHDIYKIIDENNYIIKLGEFAISTYSGGGSGITVSSERNGTRVFQSNTFTFEETGNIFRAIFLSGENYIFLTSPGLDTVYNPGNKKVGDIFAKILLKEQPGAMVFDSFISAPKIFNPPISTIKELEFEVKRKDGYLFNFNNMDYSVSIEIIEIVDQIVDTGLSGRTGTSDLY